MKSQKQGVNWFPTRNGPPSARAATPPSHRLPACWLNSSTARGDAGHRAAAESTGRTRSTQPAETTSSRSLKLTFQQANLGNVLRYLQESAGLIIHVSSNVPVDHPVDLCQEQPVSPDEALNLLKQALSEKGCALVKKGSLFNIIPSQDVKKHFIPLPRL